MITINGQVYTGNNITVNNGKVTIDGNTVQGLDEKIINISVEGNLEGNLTVDNAESIEINGYVGGSVRTNNGDVICESDIHNGASTTNGDIHASKIEGSISTVNGDICRKFR